MKVSFCDHLLSVIHPSVNNYDRRYLHINYLCPISETSYIESPCMLFELNLFTRSAVNFLCFYLQSFHCSYMMVFLFAVISLVIHDSVFISSHFIGYTRSYAVPYCVCSVSSCPAVLVPGWSATNHTSKWHHSLTTGRPWLNRHSSCTTNV